MRELTPEEKESLFPAECHFKVICLDLPGMQGKLNDVLSELRFPDNSFKESSKSTKGKYISYEVSITVGTHDHMIEIDQALRSLEGVKMLL